MRHLSKMSGYLRLSKRSGARPRADTKRSGCHIASVQVPGTHIRRTSARSPIPPAKDAYDVQARESYDRNGAWGACSINTLRHADP